MGAAACVAGAAAGLAAAAGWRARRARRSTPPSQCRAGRSRPSRTRRPTTISTNSAPTSRSTGRRSACRSAPGTIKIDGMVAKPRTIGFDDLMKQVKLEERIYRHRCVEAWAMTVPWTGFPMRDLIRMCAPDRVGQIRRDGDARGPQGDARPAAADHRLALSRGPARCPRRTTNSRSSPPACMGRICRSRTAPRSGL